jgi:hypothetical protein
MCTEAECLILEFEHAADHTLFLGKAINRSILERERERESERERGGGAARLKFIAPEPTVPWGGGGRNWLPADIIKKLSCRVV